MSPTFWIKKFRDNLNKIWTWISRHNSNFDNLNINKHVNYISLTVALGSKTKNRNYPRSQPEKFCHFFREIFRFAEFFVLDASEIQILMFQSKTWVIWVRKSFASTISIRFSLEISIFHQKWLFLIKNQTYLPWKHGHVRLKIIVMSTFSYRINHQKQNFSSKITIFLVKWLILGVVCCQHWTIGVKILELKQQVLITGLNSLVL